MNKHFLTYTDFYSYKDNDYGVVELFGITVFLCALLFTLFATFYYVDTIGKEFIPTPVHYVHVNILKGK